MTGENATAFDDVPPSDGECSRSVPNSSSDLFDAGRARVLAQGLERWRARDALDLQQCARAVGVSPAWFHRAWQGKIDPGGMRPSVAMRLLSASRMPADQLGLAPGQFQEIPAGPEATVGDDAAAMGSAAASAGGAAGVRPPVASSAQYASALLARRADDSYGVALITDRGVATLSCEQAEALAIQLMRFAALARVPGAVPA